jgi:ectoine hydroxylase-related dioxygenase (phytanoyl-CoA dioxygenase family)
VNDSIAVAESTVLPVSYAEAGFSIARGLIPAPDARALLDAAIDIARGNISAPTFVTPEQNLAHLDAPQPEDAVSKVFRVHERPPFAEMSQRTEILDAVVERLGTDDVDCFLSQFIFKNPGAWGQPCHQDSFYFPFTPSRPVVGVWIAATDAALDNGCLFVVPGSHRESVHAHEPDHRENANLGYFEITDHDLSSAVAVEMDPGDVLFFDSHLMHFSTDNASTRRRCAMVYHYARAGTVDHTVEQRGYSINDWVSVRRGRGLTSG